MVEEGELLAHERAVDAVLAGDLGEQAAELCAARAGELGLGRGHELGDRLERDARGVEAEGGAGAVQQRGALVLHARAGAHLGLDLGHRGEHAVDLAGADGGALAQDALEQAAGGDDLGLEVVEDLDAHRGGGGRAHDPLRIFSQRSWARPRPPAPVTASASVPGSMSL